MANLPLLHSAPVDSHLQVSAEEAIGMTRRLAREEGIFAGFSSGADIAMPWQLLPSIHPIIGFQIARANELLPTMS